MQDCYGDSCFTNPASGHGQITDTLCVWRNGWCCQQVIRNGRNQMIMKQKSFVGDAIGLLSVPICYIKIIHNVVTIRTMFS